MPNRDRFSTLSYPSRVKQLKLLNPTTNSFVGNNDAAFSHKFLTIRKTEIKLKNTSKWRDV